MINNIIINAESIYCTGDIHGIFTSIYNTICYHNLSNCVIFCCGDIGLGFNSVEYYKSEFSKLNKKLKSKHSYVVLLRGNHDDPDYFVSGLFKQFSNIYIVPDYTVVTINKGIYLFNTLCIGGAISIDRINRIKKNQRILQEYKKYHNIDEKSVSRIRKCYWSDENPIYDESKLIEIIEKYRIDAICTHSCPSFCQPITKDGIKYWLMLDSELDKDLYDERKVFDQVFDCLKHNNTLPQYWCYGHFHFHNQEIIENVRFYLLDMVYNNLMDIIELRQ